MFRSDYPLSSSDDERPPSDERPATPTKEPTGDDANLISDSAERIPEREQSGELFSDGDNEEVAVATDDVAEAHLRQSLLSLDKSAPARHSPPQFDALVQPRAQPSQVVRQSERSPSPGRRIKAVPKTAPQLSASQAPGRSKRSPSPGRGIKAVPKTAPQLSASQAPGRSKRSPSPGRRIKAVPKTAPQLSASQAPGLSERSPSPGRRIKAVPKTAPQLSASQAPGRSKRSPPIDSRKRSPSTGGRAKKALFGRSPSTGGRAKKALRDRSPSARSSQAASSRRSSSSSRPSATAFATPGAPLQLTLPQGSIKSEPQDEDEDSYNLEIQSLLLEQLRGGQQWEDVAAAERHAAAELGRQTVPQLREVGGGQSLGVALSERLFERAADKRITRLRDAALKMNEERAGGDKRDVRQALERLDLFKKKAEHDHTELSNLFASRARLSCQLRAQRGHVRILIAKRRDVSAWTTKQAAIYADALAVNQAIIQLMLQYHVDLVEREVLAEPITADESDDLDDDSAATAGDDSAIYGRSPAGRTSPSGRVASASPTRRRGVSSGIAVEPSSPPPDESQALHSRRKTSSSKKKGAARSPPGSGRSKKALHGRAALADDGGDTSPQPPSPRPKKKRKKEGAAAANKTKTVRQTSPSRHDRDRDRRRHVTANGDEGEAAGGGRVAQQKANAMRPPTDVTTAPSRGACSSGGAPCTHSSTPNDVHADNYDDLDETEPPVEDANSRGAFGHVGRARRPSSPASRGFVLTTCGAARTQALSSLPGRVAAGHCLTFHPNWCGIGRDLLALHTEGRLHLPTAFIDHGEPHNADDQLEILKALLPQLGRSVRIDPDDRLDHVVYQLFGLRRDDLVVIGLSAKSAAITDQYGQRPLPRSLRMPFSLLMLALGTHQPAAPLLDARAAAAGAGAIDWQGDVAAASSSVGLARLLVFVDADSEDNRDDRTARIAKCDLLLKGLAGEHTARLNLILLDYLRSRPESRKWSSRAPIEGLHGQLALYSADEAAALRPDDRPTLP